MTVTKADKKPVNDDGTNNQDKIASMAENKLEDTPTK
jgi:hypothetical protein